MFDNPSMSPLSWQQVFQIFLNKAIRQCAFKFQEYVATSLEIKLYVDSSGVYLVDRMLRYGLLGISVVSRPVSLPFITAG
jgi:hypothetical protein